MQTPDIPQTWQGSQMREMTSL